MEPRKDEFLLAQYERLRDEIDAHLLDVNALPKYGIVGSAAIWAWITTQATTDLATLAKWVPLGYVILLYMRNLAINRDIYRIGEHIRRTEEHFGVPEELGWEQRSRAKSGTPDWSDFFWPVLVLANLIIPLILEL